MSDAGLFWIVAVAQAVFLAFSLLTGQMLLRGDRVDRAREPGRFRLYVWGMAVCNVGVLGLAIWKTVHR